jgi:uncharacterized membrane protein
MAMEQHIRNPIEWGWQQAKHAGHALGSAAHAVRGSTEMREAARPAVRRIEPADLKDALAKGVADFGAYRTDVMFLCLIYPIAGLVLSRLVFGYGMLPLVFPLASGFALLGPVAAIGLYEMSRRHEQGEVVAWADAFDVVRSPAIGAIMALGLVLLAVFLLWLGAAYAIYWATLGPEPPASVGAFIHDVFTTAAGWAMIGIGVGVGFVFALVVLTISVVSFPLLLDRDVGLSTAVATSIRAVRANPRTMALWGLIVAGSLVLGAIPLLIGLAVVMPVLGHATWHLYRKAVAR